MLSIEVRLCMRTDLVHPKSMLRSTMTVRGWQRASEMLRVTSAEENPGAWNSAQRRGNAKQIRRQCQHVVEMRILCVMAVCAALTNTKRRISSGRVFTLTSALRDRRRCPLARWIDEATA